MYTVCFNSVPIKCISIDMKDRIYRIDIIAMIDMIDIIDMIIKSSKIPILQFSYTERILDDR